MPYATLPSKAVRILEKQYSPRETAPERVFDETTAQPGETRCDWAAMVAAASTYPTARGLAAGAVARAVAGDTSEGRVEELVAAGESSAPQLWAALHALIASRDPRATHLALRVGAGHWPDLWEDAFRFLSTVRSAEVEDFFIQFLVRDEGQYPWLTAIADDYLAEATTGN